MPELPEVETIRRQLEPRLKGARVVSVRFEPGKPSAIEGITEDEFVRTLTGRTFEAVGRRGKYLDIELSGGLHWIQHLRMTGKLLLRQAGAAPDGFTRFAVTLEDGRELRFADVRKFGRAWLALAPSDVLPVLGPEPWDDQFSPAYLRQRLSRGKGPIKARVLDQAVVAGVGNIYADEALFHAGIHPLRSGSRLTRAEFGRIQAAVRWALEHGVGLRGASFRDFFDVDGAQGGLQNDTFVVGRAGEPCRVCGAPVAKIKVTGRGTHFCPECQPAGRGLTGSRYAERLKRLGELTAPGAQPDLLVAANAG
jgi:formamidopyrimidine-DNA glycosylase